MVLSSLLPSSGSLLIKQECLLFHIHRFLVLEKAVRVTAKSERVGYEQRRRITSAQQPSATAQEAPKSRPRAYPNRPRAKQNGHQLSSKRPQRAMSAQKAQNFQHHSQKSMGYPSGAWLLESFLVDLQHIKGPNSASRRHGGGVAASVSL